MGTSTSLITRLTTLNILYNIIICLIFNIKLFALFKYKWFKYIMASIIKKRKFNELNFYKEP